MRELNELIDRIAEVMKLLADHGFTTFSINRTTQISGEPYAIHAYIKPRHIDDVTLILGVEPQSVEVPCTIAPGNTAYVYWPIEEDLVVLTLVMPFERVSLGADGSEVQGGSHAGGISL